MRNKGLVNTKALLCPIAMLWLSVLGGCGPQAPPYAELPLRDALSAAPEVVASLPEQALHDVAVRLEEAHAAAPEQTALASADIGTVPALVRSADAQREDNGNDAIVLGALEPAPEGFLLRSLAVSNTTEASADGIALRGLPAESTAAVENAALRGRAGAILTELAAHSDARQIVRITGLPAGVIAMNQTMYVNGSWLVALSALDTPTEVALPPPAAIEPPALDPLSVRINPYNLPATLAECAFDVQDLCTCAVGGLCDHRPTDPGFSSGQEECQWVRTGDASANARALCVLALMSIDAIRECVHAGGTQCTKLPIGSRDDALAFVADPGCLSLMEMCLDGRRPTPPSSPGSGGCNNSGSSGGCGGCDGCNQDVSNCNQNCSDCNQNCKDCNQNTQDCKNNCGSKASAQSSECRTTARPPIVDPSTVPVPIGTLFWVFGPAGYMLRRIRRRA